MQHDIIIGEVRQMLHDDRNDSMLDVRTMLLPIQEDLAFIKQRLDRVRSMAKGDFDLAYQEIEQLKKRLKKLEQTVAAIKG